MKFWDYSDYYFTMLAAITLSQKSCAEAIEAFYDSSSEMCYASMEYKKKAIEIDEELRTEFVGSSERFRKTPVDKG